MVPHQRPATIIFETRSFLARRLGLGPIKTRTIGPADVRVGLLAACGLRISEALRLVRQDVDLGQSVMTIRATKFRKTRLVPLHATAAKALYHYAHRRDRVVRPPPASTFFVTDRGTPVRYHTVRCVFDQLRAQLGWANYRRKALSRSSDQLQTARFSKIDSRFIHRLCLAQREVEGVLTGVTRDRPKGNARRRSHEQCSSHPAGVREVHAR